MTSVFKAYYFDGQTPNKIEGELRLYKNGMEFTYERKLISMSYKDFILKEDYDFLWFENNETGERISTSLENKEQIKKIVPKNKHDMVDQFKASIIPIFYFFSFLTAILFLYTFALKTNLFGTTDLLLTQAKKSLKVCQPNENFSKLSFRALTKLDKDSHEVEVLISQISIKNAFAFPGKKIIFTQQALKSFKNEKEFLGVLAHEVSHIKLKHIDGAANITQIILSTFGNSIKYAGYFLFSAYSREREKSADLNAIKLLKGADLPSDGLLTFIQELNPLKNFDTKKKYSKLLEYISTHPIESRLVYLKANTSELPKKSLFTNDEFKLLQESSCK